MNFPVNEDFKITEADNCIVDRLNQWKLFWNLIRKLEISPKVLASNYRGIYKNGMIVAKQFFPTLHLMVVHTYFSDFWWIGLYSI